MKKLLLVASLIVASVLSYPNVALSSLVAHYPFSGNTDDVISGYDGTVYGAGLSADRFGNADSAYSFDGTNDYMGIPEILTPDTPAIAISSLGKAGRYK
ncbi:MAG: hypothetical protein JW950_13320 [Deltaproteobacteria bacterium]|nr:hypothetical protein [Deltaproteobacteria bacterium]